MTQTQQFEMKEKLHLSERVKTHTSILLIFYSNNHVSAKTALTIQVSAMIQPAIFITFSSDFDIGRIGFEIYIIYE